ncbi:ATP-binding cassette domain-containing protein, partial [Methanoregula sp.]|uniref:ATP-binding cassette domain-containing protein n=1 Tax=Methanoregula sp. TaxID=2052170 RepID=UPI000CB4AD19
MSDSPVPPVIEACDLKKTYGTTIAVESIRFTVNRGEIFGFLGPNGAGKTTTMKMVTCISPRTGGTLRVLGMDPDTDPATIKGKLGVVPQETNLDVDFT